MSSPPDGEEGFLPLQIAVSNKDLAGLKALLEHSQESINSRDPWNYTPLQIAIQGNDVPAVKLLLSYGADSNLRVPDDYSDLVEGTNSLSLAASCGHGEVLRLLLDNACRLTSRSLYIAAESGRLECVAFILSWIINIEGFVFDDGVKEREAIGEALRIAAAGWRSDIVEVILQDREIERRFLGKALYWSVQDEDEIDDFHVINPVSKTTPEGREKRINSVKLLLDAGADPNFREMHLGIQGVTPLHQAARMGNRVKEIFKLFLDKASDVNSEDEAGQTPLFKAVLADGEYFTQELIAKGAISNHTDQEGCTPLHISTANLTPACRSIMTCLLDHGAQIFALTQQRETPLHLAAHHGNTIALETLLPLSDPLLLAARSATGFTALHFAADGYKSQHCIGVVNQLLSKRVDINEPTDDGRTVLHLAVTASILDKLEFISFLLENGADVDGHSSGECSSDSIHRRADVSDSVKSKLLEKDAIDTPLHLALDGGSTDLHIVYLLLRGGANIETRDAIGRTALLRCVVENDVSSVRLEIAQELIKRGANVEAVDNLGRKVDVDIWCAEQGWAQ